MTIHKSKGLEFPVCFVANLPDSYKNKESKKLALNRTKGIGMHIVDGKNMLIIPTRQHSIVAEENRRLAISEEMRLLYVAATPRLALQPRIPRYKEITPPPKKKSVGRPPGLEKMAASSAMRILGRLLPSAF